MVSPTLLDHPQVEYNRSMEPVNPNQDDESDSREADHLRVLSIFHYLLGILTFLVACLFLVHLVVGAMTMAQLSADERSRLPAGFGSGLHWIGAIGLAGGWTLAGLNLLSGWCLAHRRFRGLSLLVCVCNLAWPPVGTGLGIITMIVLARDSVRRLYHRQPAEGAA